MTRPLDMLTILAIGTEGYGVRRGLIGLAENCARRGIAADFALISDEGRLATALRERGLPFRVIANAPPRQVVGGGLGKVTGMIARGRAQFRTARALTEHVRAQGSQAIIVRSPVDTLLASLAARRAGIDAYWILPNEVASGYPLDFNRRFYRTLFHHGNLIPISNSRFTDTTLGPGDYRRYVSHLGIDPAEFDPATPGRRSRVEFGIPDDAIVIGLFARLVENKGQLQMVRAIAALGDRAKDVHLLLLGGPTGTEYEARLRAAAEAGDIADRVHLLGEQDDVFSFYQLTDVVANARLDPEPFGFSVIEGMMLGKPVLAHAAGGPSETIVDGETGWLIPSPDISAFTTALARMLDDRAAWPAMRRAARTHALAHFTADHMVERVLAIIEATRR